MKKVFTDQLDREVELYFPPQRIISLVPSQSELLFYLGLEKEVVGITKFCVHPKEQFRVKPRIGGTKKLNIEKITALQPDLLIGNKEENDRSQIEELATMFPVWISDIRNLKDALEMITGIGDLCGRPDKAGKLASRIGEKFDHHLGELLPKIKAAYFIWKDPYMVAAGNTFIHSMMKLAGLENVFGAMQRYPEVSLGQLKQADPEVILLSSEPYPFQERHFTEFQKACPRAKVLLVDGELFSWYGNRLLQTADYFHQLRLKIR